jgi:hypothetical protein
MSETAQDSDFLLESRGVSRDLGAWVVGIAWERGGGGACGFGLGDGTVRVARPAATGEEWANAAAHEGGACLSLCADARGGFLSGGDDGRLVRVAADAAVEEIARPARTRWVEHVAAHESGVRAAAVGKAVHLYDATARR